MAVVSKIDVRTVTCEGAAVLLVDRVLDSSTYRQLRDHIIKAALDEPRALVVNVSAPHWPHLTAPAIGCANAGAPNYTRRAEARRAPARW